MLASIFHGAQGLFIWTLDWLSFGASGLHGSDSLDTAEASTSHLNDVSRVQLTPKGQFEQVDRTSVLEQVATWTELAPAPEAAPEDALLLGAAAWIESTENTDADLIVQFALGDANGLSAQMLDAIGAEVAATDAFSPLIQPAMTVTLNDDETAAHITLVGTANASLDDVYMPLTFDVIDDLGDVTGFDTPIGIWNTDLI